MSPIDYQALKAAVSMERVLQLVNFQPTSRRGEQLRGRCPLHEPEGADKDRCFSVHLGRHLFQCFHCGAAGNQLDLWRRIQDVPLLEAAHRLCRQARINPPLLTPPATKRNSETCNPTPKSSPSATA